MTDVRESDPFNLRRFVKAQDDGGTFDRALAEIRRGAKTSHWMWYVFPQLIGLGNTQIAKTYGVTGDAEARAYLAHRVLGPRLLECAEAALGVQGRSAEQIFGSMDSLKLRSSATLFGSVAPAGSVFHQLLSRYYDDVPDDRTLDRLGRTG